MARVRVSFHGTFWHITQKHDDSLELAQPTLEAVVQEMGRRYGPRFSNAVRDAGGRPMPGMIVLVDGQNAPWNTPLADNSQVSFLSAIAGG